MLFGEEGGCGGAGCQHFAQGFCLSSPDFYFQASPASHRPVDRRLGVAVPRAGPACCGGRHPRSARAGSVLLCDVVGHGAGMRQCRLWFA